MDASKTVGVDTITKNLDSMILPRYIQSLESAKKHLREYLEQLDGVEKNMNKIDSPSTRKVLGEDLLISRRAIIQETIDKLEAHQAATLKRFKG